MLEVADLIRLHEGAFRARFGSRLSSAQWRALAISKPVERPTLEAISNSVLTAVGSSTPITPAATDTVSQVSRQAAPSSGCSSSKSVSYPAPTIC